MPELFEGIVATRTVCAESSLDLVSEVGSSRHKIKAALSDSSDNVETAFAPTAAIEQKKSSALDFEASFPMFVLPVIKPGGSYFTLALQAQLPFVLFTSVEEFRM